MVANKAISVKDITKKYGESKAVDGVSFEVDEGEIFGFIEPNGAGKTTTVRTLATLLPPSSGEANVLGFDVNKDSDKIRRRIGYVQHQFGVEFFMTVRGNLDTYARTTRFSGKAWTFVTVLL